jgi:hypothetical protein
MQIFISWSGDKSRDVAAALREWLPHVLQGISPFVSSRDLSAGTRWAVEIAEKLKDTEFGLVCVTRENQREPWLNFEAGAIAKKLEVSRVVPLAIDLPPAEISHPLGQFQATKITREGIDEVVKSINEASSSPLAPENLSAAIGKWWPDLEEDFQRIENTSYQNQEEPSPPDRSDREMLEEVLDTVRAFSRETPQRSADDPFRKDLTTVLTDAGATSWSVIQHSPRRYDIGVNVPLTPQLRSDLSVVGRLHRVKLNLTEIDDFRLAPPEPD